VVGKADAAGEWTIEAIDGGAKPLALTAGRADVDAPGLDEQGVDVAWPVREHLLGVNGASNDEDILPEAALPAMKALISAGRLLYTSRPSSSANIGRTGTCI